MNNSGDVEGSSSQALTEEAVDHSASVLLRRVFRILRGCGISTESLATLAAQALGEIRPLPNVPLSNVSTEQTLACCDVVLRWRRDCRFLDAGGRARRLAVHEGTSSFDELVRTAAPGNDTSDLLRTMIDLGVVRLEDATTVELISESVVTCPGREHSTLANESVLEHVCGFLGSVEFNLFDKPSRARGKFERACYAWVPSTYVPLLENLVSSRGQDFVDVIDEWLARRAVKISDTPQSVLVGAGAYVFVRNRLGV